MRTPASSAAPPWPPRLLALGIACGITCRAPTAAAAIAIGWVYLAYNLASCIGLLVLAATGLPAAPQWVAPRLAALGGSLLHGLLAAGLLTASPTQRRMNPAPAQPPP